MNAEKLSLIRQLSLHLKGLKQKRNPGVTRNMEKISVMGQPLKFIRKLTQVGITLKVISMRSEPSLNIRKLTWEQKTHESNENENNFHKKLHLNSIKPTEERNF